MVHHVTDELRLHGRTDPLGIRPVALELDGRLLTVERYRPRFDLDGQCMERSHLAQIRHYWEVWLAGGRNVVCYRDLSHPGWYLDPHASKGAAADAACAELERKAQASLDWLRQQQAEEQAKAERVEARRQRATSRG